MNDVNFKLSMMSLDEPLLNFNLSSNGKEVEYKGKDRDGNPLVVNFDIPAERGGKALERIMNALGSEDRDPDDDRQGVAWSIKQKTGGMTYSTDGMLYPGTTLKPVREEALDILKKLQEYYPVSDKNYQAMETLIKESPFFI